MLLFLRPFSGFDRLHRPGLQSGQLHADACVAEAGGTLIFDGTAGKAGQNRRCRAIGENHPSENGVNLYYRIYCEDQMKNFG